MFSWLDSFQHIGGDLVSALGTIVAAVLGAFAGVSTWVLTGAREKRATEERQQREWESSREERAAAARDLIRLRDQKALDIIVALHAEILAGVVANRRQLTREEAEYAMAQETPFATADETDFVFDNIKNDISLLPVEVIHSVVQYYRTARQSNLLTRDLRDPYFREQTPAEKRRIIGLLLQVLEVQKMLGEQALEDLAAYARDSGIDLSKQEERADATLQRAREALALIFRKSERSDLSSQPPDRTSDPHSLI
jgi:hypothetical protein